MLQLDLSSGFGAHPGRRKQKERDLGRDPAAGSCARTSRPRPPQDAGCDPRAGCPGAHRWEVGGEAERARTWKSSPARLCAGCFLAASFHLRSGGLWTWSYYLEGRGGGGGLRGPANQRVPAKAVGWAPRKWRAELGLPPKRDRAGAEAKGRSGAQQGTSHSSPGRRQSGPWRQGEGWGQEPSAPAPKATWIPPHLVTLNHHVPSLDFSGPIYRVGSS